MNQFTPVLGIDLGTTYSCVAYVDETGKSVVLPNHEGERTTPSVVAFEHGKIIVGNTAKETAKIDPHNVISFIKRQIGKEDGWYYADESGNKLGPEEISAYILKKLVADASEKLGQDVKDVVITVPAYFGINEREATKRAGEIAGLNVLGIIAEPIAAAFAYGATSEDKNVLVYDLGGGTFDVTVIRFTPKCYQSVVVRGDHELGGKDWDERILRYLLDRFCELAGVDSEEVSDDAETMADLQDQAERVVKKQLTSRESASVAVSHDGRREKVEVTRAKFEELTADLLGQTIETTRLAIEDAAAKGVTKIDEIILVGGSSKMPQVLRAIEENFTNIPVKLFDPDESVAKGAAIVAKSEHLLSSYNELQQIVDAMLDDQTAEEAFQNMEDEQKQILHRIAGEQGTTALALLGSVAKEYETVCSKSFGIVAIDSVTDQEKVSNLVLLNTKLPLERVKKFQTHAVGDNVEIRIMENVYSEEEATISDSKEIGKSTLNFGSTLPAGSPLRVEFVLNKDGTLTVLAVDLTTNKSIEVVVETQNVIQGEELHQAIARTAGLSIE